MIIFTHKPDERHYAFRRATEYAREKGKPQVVAVGYAKYRIYPNGGREILPMTGKEELICGDCGDRVRSTICTCQEWSWDIPADLHEAGFRPQAPFVDNVRLAIRHGYRLEFNGDAKQVTAVPIETSGTVIALPGAGSCR